MLFEPYNFAGLTLSNRIVRSATYLKMADEDGHVTDRLVRTYRDLARGGSGLIITGYALVHTSGRAAPKMLCIHSDIYIDGLRRLTDAVHEADGLIAIQLVHGGRQSPQRLLGGNAPLAPSAVHEPITRGMPEAMSDSRIWEMIDAFADAAWRARSAGFDAVQLHGAHGYLISNFLSAFTNLRDDYWGGDAERRTHFAEEVVKAVRQAVGGSYPLLMKVNCHDLLGDEGLKPEESLGHVRRMIPAGLDAVELSGGTRDSKIKTIRPDILKPADEAYFRTAGGLFKDKLDIPVILTGGMRSRTVMEEVLKKGEADLIGLSRPLIREPDLPNRMHGGQDKATCVSCNLCTRFPRLEYVQCKQRDDEHTTSATPGTS